MENNNDTEKNNNEANSSEEKIDAPIAETKVEPIVEPRNKKQINRWYILAGFLIIVGSLITVNDIYSLFNSYFQYLSLYNMSFWDLTFDDQSNFFIYIFKYLSLGIAQIVSGFLLYMYAKNKNEVKTDAS